MILAFYNFAIFDKYFGVFWLRPLSQAPCMFIVPPPGVMNNQLRKLYT